MTTPPHRDSRPGPRWTGEHGCQYVLPPMRYLLVIWLSLGMAPGLGEVAESVAHFLAAGHLAHSEADHGDLGNQGDEHGCGTTQHHCGCCASQVVAAAPAVTASEPVLPSIGPVGAEASLVSLNDPAPPHRPPIAS